MSYVAFSLDKNFVNTFAAKKPPFGFNGLGEMVYLRTYSRIKNDGTQESWFETVERVVNGTYRMQQRHIETNSLGWDADVAQKSAQEMYDRMWNMKFLPPGRGLWAMGSAMTEERELYSALNNPLHEDTRVLTQEYGWIPLKDVEGQTVTVLTSTKLYGRDNTSSSASPTWKEASISSAEYHPSVRITYESKFGDSYSVVASENHRWFRRINTNNPWERVTTLDLKVGDWMPRTSPSKNFKMSYQGAQHGYFFGDGTRSNGELHQFTPEKRQVLHDLFTRVETAPDIESGLEHEVVRQCPLAWGDLPEGSYVRDQRYVYGFLAGYFAADGSLSANGQAAISSARLSELEAVKDLFTDIGIRTSTIALSSTSSNFKDVRVLYKMHIDVNDVQGDFFLRENHKDIHETLSSRTQDWLRVTAVEAVEGLQRVLCATVPVYEQFVVEGWALTSNCAFVSTDNLKKDLHEPFTFLMDASMLGVGVGFDTKGAGQIKFSTPKSTVDTFVVPDTREGWVEALKRLLLSYFKPNQNKVEFDYSLVRPAGAPIKGFGGVASGPAPLSDMLEKIRDILFAGAFHDRMISVTDIVDIQNLIGKCVVAGNIRRSAEIAFGEADDAEFIDLKNAAVNPERNDWNTGWGWTSNNSIFAKLGMDYTDAAKRVALNGEPGFAWLGNMQDYGRMIEAPNYKDKKAAGGNPCLEQTLESFELCCLVETFPARCDDLQDYLRTLKFAYLYAKTVTLGKTHWSKTNKVLLKNRRIGLSQSGIQQAVAKLGIDQYKTWCEVGYETVQHYDKVYADWLAIPRSIKTTSVKPSGSVSLLAGATPGMHWPESKTYIRRMRLSAISDLVPAFVNAGYHVEPAKSDSSSVVVSIPVKIEEDIRTVGDVSIWEQFAMAAFMQRYWADNQVSCTVTFNPTTEANQIAPALNYYQYQLKGISLLPRADYGAYPQMPYEAIDKETYETMLAAIKPISFGKTAEEATSERFCDGDACIIL